MIAQQFNGADFVAFHLMDPVEYARAKKRHDERMARKAANFRRYTRQYQRIAKRRAKA